MIGLTMTTKKEAKRARSRANNRIAFLGHAVVFGCTNFFLLVVAGLWPAVITSLSWGIGLAAHGFWAVLAPELRERWTADEVSRQVKTTVVREKKAMGNEHAREMHRLSAAVAHEIRNPITAAKSLVQQMGEDPTAGDNVEYAKVAIEELDRVERSIAHLLRYARDQEVRRDDIRLGDVVRSALDNMSDRLATFEVDCQLTDDDGLRGDSEALRRVIINLLNNACDAVVEAAPATPQIFVSIGAEPLDNELWVKVSDNGTGIDERTREAMFDPFHTTKDQGTGLGLAICKKLVEAHGGTIEVTPANQLSVGSELVLRFPRNESEDV
jgi:signal transduction histidine kinase